MATSGSYDFSQNRDQIIKDSMVSAGILDPFETPKSEENVFASNELNRMLKGWQVDGLHLWLVQKAYLFLEKDQHEYSLGPTGDNFTQSFVSTTIGADEASGQTAITVTSSTGMTAADVVLIVQDDGTLHESTIASVDDATTITIDDATTDEAASGNVVYTYTTKAQRPIRVQQAIYKSGDTETKMYQVSRDDFRSIPNKTTDSRPTQWYFDPQLTNAMFSIYGEPNEVSDYLTLVCHFPIEDMDAAANDFGFPHEWFDAIHYNMAYRLAVQFGAPEKKVKYLQAQAFYLKERAMGWDEEKSHVEMRPDETWLQG